MAPHRDEGGAWACCAGPHRSHSEVVTACPPVMDLAALTRRNVRGILVTRTELAQASAVADSLKGGKAIDFQIGGGARVARGAPAVP